MINFTLTIMAAPELLAAMTNFTSAITAAKVVAIPEYNSDFTDHKVSKEQTAASHNQTVPQTLYQEKNPSIQQGMGSQQTMQAQAPAAVIPMYNQPNTVPGNQINNPGALGPAYVVQPVQQATVQTIPAQGTSVPTSAHSYTMEQLAVAATQLVDAGRRTELVSLLSSFGVQALTALPKEQYGAFATQLRTLGAKI
jgi:hypothetical protein